jgi:spore coat protein CotH
MVLRFPINLTIILAIFSLLGFGNSSYAGVVINELQYNPESGDSNDEFIELFNTDLAAVDLSGWSFGKGVKFTFPAGTVIEPRGFLALVPSLERFNKNYGQISSPIVGNYAGKLANEGEQVVLLDASGQEQSKVEYSDSWPWNPDADGSGRSLERIDPDSPIIDYRNWSPSGIQSATGTPGSPNSAMQPGVPPFIAEVRHTPNVPNPDKSVQVTAQVEISGLLFVFLHYDAGAGYQSLRMEEEGAGETGEENRNFSTHIPGQAAGTLVRYYVEAVGAGGEIRRYPCEAPVYGLGWRVTDPTEQSPLVRDELILDPLQLQFFYNFPYELERQTFGSCILDGVLYDNILIRLRGMTSREFAKKNWRVTFPKSHLWKGQLNRLNFNSDYHDASHMRNALSMEVLGSLGIPTPQIQHVRMYFNNAYFGVFYRLEHMNADWLERVGKNPKNDMYESYHDHTLLDSIEAYQSRYNKKTGKDTSDFSSLIQFIEGLNAQPSTESGPYIEKVFDVDSLLIYMVGRSLLSNKDDTKKNQFLYLNDNDRWEIFPHDWDITWGHEWDDVLGALNKNFTTTMISFEVYTNALMAVVRDDPSLRKRFYEKLKTTLAEAFHEDAWYPRIDALYQLIRQDVYRDNEKWESNAEFDAQPQQLKDYITQRRKYLLEVEIPVELGTPVSDWALY